MNSVGPYEAVALYKSVPYMCVYARARARVCMWVYFTHERVCISSGANRLPVVSFFFFPTELCS